MRRAPTTLLASLLLAAVAEHAAAAEHASPSSDSCGNAERCAFELEVSDWRRLVL
jgi:hypothetical protein